MRVVAFAPSLLAEEAQDGGVNMRGFPMTSAFVDLFPVEITVPIVLGVCALSGAEYNPTQYIAVTSPTGERVSTMQFGWQWDDVPGLPVKYRAFVQYLPLHLESAGVYTIGLYDTPECDASEHTFPFPVFLNPLAGEPDRITLGDGPRL